MPDKTIEELTTELNKAKTDLKTANDALGLATTEIERLKVASPKDGVDLAQKNIRIELDGVTQERDGFKVENQQLKSQLIKVNQDLDQANRAKIIGDLKNGGCKLSTKEYNAMSTEELDGLRDAKNLFGEGKSAGIKAFGDVEAWDPNSRLTVPDRFLSLTRKGGS